MGMVNGSMTRLDHVRGMINKIERLALELYVMLDKPVMYARAYELRPRYRLDVFPRSKKAAVVWHQKHKRVKRLYKELYTKHGQFIKDNELPSPNIDGRITVLK